MTKQYYECHITMNPSSKVDAERVVKSTGWIFSAIDNDIVLGEGVKCYATKHFNLRVPEEDVLAELGSTSVELAAHGLSVVRAKIEKVIYDEKFNV